MVSHKIVVEAFLPLVLLIMKFLFLLASLALTTALDVKITSVTCDESLPVTADIKLQCDGSDRCTFGEELTVEGTLYYNGLDATNIANNLGYATTNITFVGLNFNLFENKAVSLCGYNMVPNGYYQEGAYGGYGESEYGADAEYGADGEDQDAAAASGYGGDAEGYDAAAETGEYVQYQCPGDGSYNYSVSYTLPSAGKESQSYLGSGWMPTGVIQMFADQDSDELIGECTLNLVTFVTHKSGQDYDAPPASIVSAVVLGSLLLLSLIGFCCCCCTKTTPQEVRHQIQPYRVKGEDSVMSFRRMTEADRMA